MTSSSFCVLHTTCCNFLAFACVRSVVAAMSSSVHGSPSSQQVGGGALCVEFHTIVIRWLRLSLANPSMHTLKSPEPWLVKPCWLGFSWSHPFLATAGVSQVYHNAPKHADINEHSYTLEWIKQWITESHYSGAD